MFVFQRFVELSLKYLQILNRFMIRNRIPYKYDHTKGGLAKSAFCIKRKRLKFQPFNFFALPLIQLIIGLNYII